MKVAFAPEAAVCASGWAVISSRVSVAASEVTDSPLAPVTMQRYWRPLTVEVALTVRFSVLKPERLVLAH